MELNYNERTAYELRKKNKTFSEIGKILNLSAARALEIYYKADWKLNRDPHWTDGLSRRSINVLHNAGIKTKKDAIKSIKNGSLQPKGTKYFGWVSYKEVCEFLGLPMLYEKSKRKNICIHCGKVYNKPEEDSKKNMCQAF